MRRVNGILFSVVVILTLLILVVYFRLRLPFRPEWLAVAVFVAVWGYVYRSTMWRVSKTVVQETREVAGVLWGRVTHASFRRVLLVAAVGGLALLYLAWAHPDSISGGTQAVIATATGSFGGLLLVTMPGLGALLVACVIMARYKVHCLISPPHPQRSVSPTGMWPQAVLFMTSCLLGFFFYDSVDRILQRRIVERAGALQGKMHADGRQVTSAHLKGLRDYFDPFLKDGKANDNLKALLDSKDLKSLILKSTKSAAENKASPPGKDKEGDKGSSPPKDKESSVGTSLALSPPEMERVQDSKFVQRLEEFRLVFDVKGSERTIVEHHLIRSFLEGANSDNGTLFGKPLVQYLLGTEVDNAYKLDESAVRPPFWENPEKGWRDSLGALVSDYARPRSFEVSSRVAKAAHQVVRVDNDGREDQREVRIQLFLIAAVFAGGAKVEPELWLYPPANTVQTCLSTGPFQDLFRGTLERLNTLSLDDAGTLVTDEKGQIEVSSPPLFGMTVFRIREMVRGAVQYAITVCFIWGLLFVLFMRLLPLVWQLGHLPFHEETATLSEHVGGAINQPQKTWAWFWALSSIDARDKQLHVIYDAARESEDLPPQAIACLLKACNPCRSPFLEVENQVKAVVVRWEAEQNKANSFVEFVVFALPNLGFMGTIIGLTSSLAQAYEIGIPSPDPFHRTVIIGNMSTQLGMAFYTTLVGLLALMPMAFILYLLVRFQSFVARQVVKKTLDLWSRMPESPPAGERSQ